VRLLHTSDWHLGQTLHGFERTYEHERFLAWLLETLVSEQIDALLVAGDLFDSANPPAACQRLLFEFLATARCDLPQLDIVLVAGNHDSAGRLEAPSPILDAFGIRVIGVPKRLPDGRHDLASLVVPLSSADGRIGAWCMAVPFLRPGDVPRVADTPDPYTAGITALYADVLSHTLTRRTPGQAVIAMGHCHLVGGKISEDSERRILIGGAEALSAEIFGPEIAYAALGHLHLAQAVGRPDRRYSGSPLPLSFAEVGYPHQVLVIDLDGEAVRDIRELPVPRSVELLRIPAALEPLDTVLTLLQSLTLAPLPEAEQPYLEVRVRLDAPEPGLRARIEEALTGKPVRLARIDARNAAQAASALDPAANLDALERLNPEDVFARLYRDRYGDDAPVTLRTALSELLLEEADA
jgi:exonuclease SbcD